jgi:hypothetical protein
LAKRVPDELRRVRVPLNDVDALAVQLVHDVLDADSAQSDARTHRVDTFLLRRDCYLAAVACFSRD